MTTAISMFVILTLSAIAIRAGAVALWVTGLPEYVARFQALSAFTTTGFTTSQASLVVNHPDRRRIISVLMILGNAGIISVMATVILSYIEFEVSATSLVYEVLWLTAAGFLFWFVVISKWADRYTTQFIHWCLRAKTRLRTGRIEHLLLLPNGYQVAAVTVGNENESLNELLSTPPETGGQAIVLGVLHADDTYVSAPLKEVAVNPTDRVLLYGTTRDLEAIHRQAQGEGLKDNSP